MLIEKFVWYAEPTLNAPVSFRQRINELAVLEARTVQKEKSRKIKKKQSKDSL